MPIENQFQRNWYLNQTNLVMSHHYFEPIVKVHDKNFKKEIETITLIYYYFYHIQLLIMRNKGVEEEST